MQLMPAIKLPKLTQTAKSSFSRNEQAEFMQTVEDMQAQSAKNGNSKMSLREINKEIANARKQI